ncbi:MAG: FAD-dependent oxidoreductase [Myxococcota bacterium]
MVDREYDVIVVGGRVAGASLAARLGAAGLGVLVLDRSSFPSRPSVSAPFVLPHTLAMLDELGLQEQDYAADTPRLETIALEFGSHFRAFFGFPEPIAGRTYFYTIDRARLDHALWRNLERHAGVTALERTSAIDLLEQQGRVVGVVARVPGRERSVKLRARCVVGAGGRFDLVARKARASVIHERRDLDTAVYYAHWEGVEPYDEGRRPIAQIHTSGDGLSFVLMPTADQQTIVVVQAQARLHAAQPGRPAQIYDALLRACPAVWRRLSPARRVSRISGLKRMGNLFRQAHGPGWVLVGDALHHKDSIDAQGIYDALLSSRLLGESLVDWHAGRDWDDALGRYAEASHAALRPMFEATMDRVEREIYGTPPALAAKTLLRWILTDRRYNDRFAAVLTRRHDPRGLLAPSVVLPAVVSGAWRRILARLRARPDPTDPVAPADPLPPPPPPPPPRVRDDERGGGRRPR